MKSEFDMESEIALAFARNIAEREDDIFMQRPRWYIRARGIGRMLKRFGWKARNIFR